MKRHALDYFATLSLSGELAFDPDVADETVAK